MSRTLVRGSLAFALIFALAPVARAELVDIKWNGDAFSHKASIAPKKFLEVCGKLKKDQSVSRRFNGGAPTDFNIHYHVGKDVVYPEKRKDVGTAAGTLVVPLDQDFCWMWSNKSAQSVEVDVTLKIGARSGK